MRITVLTTVYNRANTINKLYNSLIKQTASNFEWLIIDDGSNDDVKEIVNEFIRQNKIKIRYYIFVVMKTKEKVLESEKNRACKP